MVLFGVRCFVCLVGSLVMMSVLMGRGLLWGLLL